MQAKMALLTADMPFSRARLMVYSTGPCDAACEWMDGLPATATLLDAWQAIPEPEWRAWLMNVLGDDVAEAYDLAVESEREAFDDACASRAAMYEAECAPAKAAYEADMAIAHGVYAAACDPARAAYTVATEEGRATHYAIFGPSAALLDEGGDRARAASLSTATAGLRDARTAADAAHNAYQASVAEINATYTLATATARGSYKGLLYGQVEAYDQACRSASALDAALVALNAKRMGE